MKKQALALFGAIAIGTSATATPHNLYVQADTGYAHLTAKEPAQTLDGGDALARVAVGVVKSQTRFSADYTRFGSAEHKTHATKTLVAGEVPFLPAGDYPVERTTELDAQSLGVSAHYDFTNDSKITPYVGARLGVNRLSREVSQELQHGFADYDLSEQAKHKTSVGVGVSAGVSYRVLPAVSADVGAEYHHLGKMDDTKASQYGAKVGVRYQF